VELDKISIGKICGVSNARLLCLNKLGIFSVLDILYFFPKAYENRVELTNIICLQSEKETSVRATVIDAKHRVINQKLCISSFMVADNSGEMKITFFNKKFVLKQLEIGKEYIFFGKATQKYGIFEMTQPEFERVEKASFLSGLTPKYPLTKGITQNIMISITKKAIESFSIYINETLSIEIRKSYNLCELLYAISNIHFPKDNDALITARKRLAFEELFYLILGLKKLKQKNQKELGPKLSNYKIVEKFAELLPFGLTNAQKRVIREICSDFRAGFQMNRLVQGDVGSGKTVVAAMAMLVCVNSGYQAALMVPTEILARQHYEGLKDYFSKFHIRVELLVSSITKKQKDRILESLEKGEINIIIGTHSIIYDKVKFNKFGLGITDEQHRFGVKDRLKLSQKGENPHILVMTATPIPRTLALIIYGDLDVSIIDELPKGRVPITTRVINSKNDEKVYSFIEKELKKGNQAFVVCPLIEESEILDMENTQRIYEKLKTDIFPNYKIGLLHGKLKANEKEEIMQKLQRKEISVVVSTSVIEVGVDIANATVIMILNAERFGLASLHQLRGRVGRGAKESYCFLVLGDVKSKERLEILEKSTDGFKISEFDLKNRGPGEFFGTRQHGLPSLRLSNITYTMETVNLAKVAADFILSEDSELKQEKNKVIKQQVNNIFSKRSYINQM
jgi:ATP-dependent DNA helicase RecG